MSVLKRLGELTTNLLKLNISVNITDGCIFDEYVFSVDENLEEIIFLYIDDSLGLFYKIDDLIDVTSNLLDAIHLTDFIDSGQYSIEHYLRVFLE